LGSLLFFFFLRERERGWVLFYTVSIFFLTLYCEYVAVARVMSWFAVCAYTTEYRPKRIQSQKKKTQTYSTFHISYHAIAIMRNMTRYHNTTNDCCQRYSFQNFSLVMKIRVWIRNK